MDRDVKIDTRIAVVAVVVVVGHIANSSREESKTCLRVGVVCWREDEGKGKRNVRRFIDLHLNALLYGPSV